MIRLKTQCPECGQESIVYSTDISVNFFVKGETIIAPDTEDIVRNIEDKIQWNYISGICENCGYEFDGELCVESIDDEE